MKRNLFRLLALPTILVLSSCATYIPPGGKADLQAFAPPSIQEGFAAEPTCPFPASIAVVRLQAPAYSNYNLGPNQSQSGRDRYSVITTREVEEQYQFDRVSELPQVSGLVTLNKMLLPSPLEGDRSIREAASRLQADLVFLYTFDTAFFDTDASKPLTVITLGLSPTRSITASTTVSALLMDTRTGYIYSAYEVTEKEATLSTSWGSGDNADKVRRKTEAEAFGKVVGELISSWPQILKRCEENANQTGGDNSGQRDAPTSASHP